MNLIDASRLAKEVLHGGSGLPISPMEAMASIVLPKILSYRKGVESDKQSKGNKKLRDTRPIIALEVSGKGGIEGVAPDELKKRLEYRNVTWLGHSSSVAAHSARLACVDMMLRADDGDDMNVIKKNARQAAFYCMAIGMIHDTDKLLKLDAHDVTAEKSGKLWEQFGIFEFLQVADIRATPEILASLVAMTEERTSGEHHSSAAPRVAAAWVRSYVRAADRWDSLWLRGNSLQAADAVISDFNESIKQGIIHQEWRGLKKIVVTDPQHPFLLQQFYEAIETRCDDICGMPPLFHLHLDGRIVSLVPEAIADAVVTSAIDWTLTQIPFETTLMVKSQGKPKFMGTPPSDGKNFRDFLHTEGFFNSSESLRLLLLHSNDLDKAYEPILEQAMQVGIPMRPKDDLRKGSLPPCVSKTEGATNYDNLRMALAVSLMLGLDSSIEKKTPVHHLATERENWLLKKVAQTDIPENIDTSSWNQHTKRTYLSLLITNAIVHNPELEEGFYDYQDKLFDAETGLFCASEETQKADKVRKTVAARLRAMVSGKLIEMEGADKATKTCLITGEPILIEKIGDVGPTGIKVEEQAMAFGIKSSAISYREGRAEDKRREVADTHLSMTSWAETRIRQRDAAIFGNLKQEEGVLVRVSSSTNGGMSSWVASPKHREAIIGRGRRDVRLWEALKNEVAEDAPEPLNPRVLYGRFTVQNTNFKDILFFLKACLTTALTTGQSIHIFRGLPMERPEFFYHDSLPAYVRDAWGGKQGLRVEECRPAMDIIDIAEAVGSSDGLRDVALAKEFLFPRTRFRAAVQVWAKNRNAESPPLMGRRTQILQEQLQQLSKEEERMNTSGLAPVLKLADLASSIQRNPGWGWKASNNEEIFLLKSAMDGAVDAHKASISDEESLIDYVAGRIKGDGDRKDMLVYARSKDAADALKTAIDSFAKIFVQEIWFGSLKGRPPSASTMRPMTDAYRWRLSNGTHARSGHIG